MSPFLVLALIAGYFGILVVIANITSKETDGSTFFIANKAAPWYLVAFGMIGTSLSGVTFVSVPGQVGIKSFSYLQLVMGYLLGYFVIGSVLMPLYYRLNLISIYTYLENRFGYFSYKTGAFFFLISRSLGSAARFYLVINILQLAVFAPLGIPFPVTVSIAIGLIWLYTHKGGLKTIIYTDTLQTFFMLASVVFTIYHISDALELSVSSFFEKVWTSPYSNTFFGDWKTADFFPKQFFAGALIAIVMTGLDQDMMQKNLACKNIKEAQKNMLWFTITLFVVNIFFLTLGAGLYLYAAKNAIALPSRPDDLFPTLALNYFPPFAGIIFILGIIAATYASTDSALTALTTSFCIDFLDYANHTTERQEQARRLTHLGFSALLLILVLAIHRFNDGSLIITIFKMATYTYGPLLGLYTYGLFTQGKVNDRMVPFVCLIAPALTFWVNENSEEFLRGYKFGFELLLVNGIFTILGLYLSGLWSSASEKQV